MHTMSWGSRRRRRGSPSDLSPLPTSNGDSLPAYSSPRSLSQFQNTAPPSPIPQLFPHSHGHQDESMLTFKQNPGSNAWGMVGPKDANRRFVKFGEPAGWNVKSACARRGEYLGRCWLVAKPDRYFAYVLKPHRGSSWLLTWEGPGRSPFHSTSEPSWARSFFTMILL